MLNNLERPVRANTSVFFLTGKYKIGMLIVKLEKIINK